MTAELLYFAIYLLQQLGVMLAVGAQTILLCAHLVAVHRGESEPAVHASARAARTTLGVGLAVIVISGTAAVGMHYAAGELEVLLAPVFLLKWALIGVLIVAFFIQRRAVDSAIFHALVGGSWYAVFLVHSLAPVASWADLCAFYAAWMFVFMVIWFGFLGFMRVQRSPQAAASSKVLGSPRPELVVPRVQAGPDHLPTPPPAPIVPPPPPLPLPPKPEPIVVAENLPVIAPEHALTVVTKVEEPPKPAAPAPASPPLPPQEKKPDILHDIVDYLLIPAMRIMPQRPEDISSEKRGPLIK